MNRVLLLVGVCVVVGGAVALSRTRSPDSEKTGVSGIQATVEDKNPWTSLKVNADVEQFQFAVVSDRTGGHRPKVFSQAVQRINMLQPEFVVSVGDLIEGYTTKDEVMATQWKEFTGYIDQLQMPFFYVPGNHDLTNKELNADWTKRFGRKFYHFVYKNTLFLCVNSEDGKASTIAAEQTEYFKKALADNKDVKWTMVFLHKPLWVDKDLEKNGWANFEKTLEGRKYTVFCGHVHRYQKFVRNGMNYYQLATTGGGSRLRGVTYGEFDHISWITMKTDGPRITNVMLDGILPENLDTPQSEEEGVIRKLKKLEPVKGLLTNNGKPVAGATVGFHSFVKEPTERFAMVADGFTAADGSFTPSTYAAFDGIPAGEYTVTVTQTGKYYDGDVMAKSQLPEKYTAAKTTTLKVTVKENEKNNIKIELMD